MSGSGSAVPGALAFACFTGAVHRLNPRGGQDQTHFQGFLIAPGTEQMHSTPHCLPENRTALPPWFSDALLVPLPQSVLNIAIDPVVYPQGPASSGPWPSPASAPSAARCDLGAPAALARFLTGCSLA